MGGQNGAQPLVSAVKTQAVGEYADRDTSHGSRRPSESVLGPLWLMEEVHDDDGTAHRAGEKGAQTRQRPFSWVGWRFLCGSGDDSPHTGEHEGMQPLVKAIAAHDVGKQTDGDKGQGSERPSEAVLRPVRLMAEMHEDDEAACYRRERGTQKYQRTLHVTTTPSCSHERDLTRWFTDLVVTCEVGLFPVFEQRSLGSHRAGGKTAFS